MALQHPAAQEGCKFISQTGLSGYARLECAAEPQATACKIGRCAAVACRFISLECRCGAALLPEACHEGA